MYVSTKLVDQQSRRIVKISIRYHKQIKTPSIYIDGVF